MKYSVCHVMMALAAGQTCAQPFPTTAQVQVDTTNTAARHIASNQEPSLLQQTIASGRVGGRFRQKLTHQRLHRRSGQDPSGNALRQRPAKSSSTTGSSKSSPLDKTSTNKQQNLRTKNGSPTSTPADINTKRGESPKANQPTATNNHRASLVASLVLANQDRRAKKSMANAQEAYLQAEHWERKAEGAWLVSPWNTPSGAEAVVPLEGTGRPAAHAFAKERDKYLADQKRHQKSAVDAFDVKHRLLRMGARYPGQTAGEKPENPPELQQVPQMEFSRGYRDYPLE